MGDGKEKATAWAKAVGQWVGDSPYKAATFGAVCVLIGIIIRSLWLGG